MTIQQQNELNQNTNNLANSKKVEGFDPPPEKDPRQIEFALADFELSEAQIHVSDSSEKQLNSAPIQAPAKHENEIRQYQAGVNQITHMLNASSPSSVAANIDIKVQGPAFVEAVEDDVLQESELLDAKSDSFEKSKLVSDDKYMFRNLSYDEKLKSIPNKMAFKIGEVAEMLNVKAYVLRYWETEFDELSPKKSQNNQRMYTRRNVEMAFLIQKLLHSDRFSIEGARKYLKSQKAELQRAKELRQITESLFYARRELKTLIRELRNIRF